MSFDFFDNFRGVAAGTSSIDAAAIEVEVVEG
jgi:hypothetical protein